MVQVASVYPDPVAERDLRTPIEPLAQRYTRYGAGMIYLKLRQAEVVVNHKRVVRTYPETRLQVRLQRRK